VKRTGLPLIAWILTGLLGLSAALLSMGQQDSETNPDSSSYSPSGLSAFRQVLMDAGYQVVINRQERPKLQPNDVAIAFERKTKPKDQSIALTEVKSEEKMFQSYFQNLIEVGHKGILFKIDKDYYTASKQATAGPPAVVKDAIKGTEYHVSQSSDLDQLNYNSDDGNLTLLTTPTSAFARIQQKKNGQLIVVRDGIGVTNRFIDKADNARCFVSLVAAMAPPRSRIVLLEASFGNVRKPSLMEAIGPWANAAWQQLLFLGLVIAYTLSRRFGIGEETRPVQRGSRELVDALGDTLGRARANQATLAALAKTADNDIRLALKLPRDATRAERDRHLPATLQSALAHLDAAATMERIPEDQALILVKRAQTELREFLGPTKRAPSRLAKMKR